jgi:hypothetical protein
MEFVLFLNNHTTQMQQWEREIEDDIVKQQQKIM